MSYRVVGHMIGRANDGRTNDGRTPVLEFVKCLNMCKNQKVEENMPVPTAIMIFFSPPSNVLSNKHHLHCMHT